MQKKKTKTKQMRQRLSQERKRENTSAISRFLSLERILRSLALLHRFSPYTRVYTRSPLSLSPTLIIYVF